MKVNIRFAIALLVGSLSLSAPLEAPAQQPDRITDELFDFQSSGDEVSVHRVEDYYSLPTSPSDRSRTAMTPAEMRMARAIYRKEQRIARLEYRAWNGYEPLRPTWNANPMTSSRYGRSIIYVPVYVYH
ncbi:hypothetical protein Q31b_56540 [Novipirellula aureliae]|uniref:Uncharacterized protein n=1 Tax=Novipirellula aureliae TaxID=2527966 RepID=A0A5C6DAK1_9BACT|nr:hypothetical protein [Novipirellula aureliae]TWU34183.1 hypothetical protein Q31b_56540 [Novipirellula aureliae]